MVRMTARHRNARLARRGSSRRVTVMAAACSGERSSMTSPGSPGHDQVRRHRAPVDVDAVVVRACPQCCIAPALALTDPHLHALRSAASAEVDQPPVARGSIRVSRAVAQPGGPGKDARRPWGPGSQRPDGIERGRVARPGIDDQAGRSSSLLERKPATRARATSPAISAISQPTPGAASMARSTMRWEPIRRAQLLCPALVRRQAGHRRQRS